MSTKAQLETGDLVKCTGISDQMSIVPGAPKAKLEISKVYIVREVNECGGVKVEGVKNGYLSPGGVRESFFFASMRFTKI